MRQSQPYDEGFGEDETAQVSKLVRSVYGLPDDWQDQRPYNGGSMYASAVRVLMFAFCPRLQSFAPTKAGSLDDLRYSNRCFNILHKVITAACNGGMPSLPVGLQCLHKIELNATARYDPQLEGMNIAMAHVAALLRLPALETLYMEGLPYMEHYACRDVEATAKLETFPPYSTLQHLTVSGAYLSFRQLPEFWRALRVYGHSRSRTGTDIRAMRTCLLNSLSPFYASVSRT